MFELILLAVDGSEHAQRAAAVAADLARALKAREVRVVVAYEPVPVYLGEPNMSRAIAAHTKEAEEILDKARVVIGDIPAELHTEILEGPVAEAILAVARTRKSDIIVMGSRGRGRLEGALLGSNSQKVVSHAPCPVLIVR
jgi:nucleotide-binding universal stress UspA family protein